eukprot:588204-Rhodomonas_salina.2
MAQQAKGKTHEQAGSHESSFQNHPHFLLQQGSDTGCPGITFGRRETACARIIHCFKSGVRQPVERIVQSGRRYSHCVRL